MEICALTHRGKVRKYNEDTVYYSGETLPAFAIVADGMGGHRGGRVASEMAVELICSALGQKPLAYITERELAKIVSDASGRVFERAQKDVELYQMGTTVTLAVMRKGELLGAHVGDSRLYLFARCCLTRLTKDHTYVQYLVDRNIISQEEADSHPYRNILTRAVGMQSLEAQTFTRKLAEGDTVFLCSDGLYGHVSDREILSGLNTRQSVKEQGEELLNCALERGGRDNISLIIARMEAGER